MDTVILNESGFDTGMEFEEYCDLAAEHGDDPRDYGNDIEEFVFVSKSYARNDPNWWDDGYKNWPEDLPLWQYRPVF